MDKLQSEYSRFVSGFSWDLYHTQTFKTTRHDGCNAVTAWWNKMEGRLGWTRGFAAVEKHKLGGVHIHALVADDFGDWTSIKSGYSQLQSHVDATKKYTDKAFGWSKSVPIVTDSMVVSMYCSKYITKDYGDYYFLGHWSGEKG